MSEHQTLERGRIVSMTSANSALLVSVRRKLPSTMAWCRERHVDLIAIQCPREDCLVWFVVCVRCYRGQRYCSDACRAKARKATRDRAREKDKEWLKEHPEALEEQRKKHARQQRDSRKGIKEEAARRRVTEQGIFEAGPCCTIENRGESTQFVPTPCAVEQSTPVVAEAAPRFASRPIDEVRDGEDSSRQDLPGYRCSICGRWGQVRRWINADGTRGGDWQCVEREDSS